MQRQGNEHGKRSVARWVFQSANVILLMWTLGGCEAISGTAEQDSTATTTSDQVVGRPRAESSLPRREQARRDQRPAVNDGQWYTMTAREFLESAPARRRIDLQSANSQLLAAAVFHETNRRRSENGLPALRHLEELDEAAMIHAQSMAEDEYLSHTNRDPDLRDPVDRVRAAGLRDPRFVAENIATAFGIRYESGTNVYVKEGPPVPRAGGRRFSYEPDGKPIPNHTYRTFARELVDAWMNSPGHRDNILHRSPTHMGHACVRAVSEDGIPLFYCAQEFYAD